MTVSIIEPNVLGDGTFSRASTGTFVGSNGLVQTAAINVPRLQYNAADLGAAPTLLVEPPATNLLITSARFATNWTKNGWVGWTDDFGVAPDGATTTTRSVTGGTAFRTSTVPASSIAVASMHYRKAVGASVFLFVDGAGVGTTRRVTLNLETLLFTTPTAGVISYGFEDLGDFVRAYMVFTTSAVGGTAANHLHPTVGVVEAWGADLVIGATMGSHIPTAGAAVTRAADIVSSTGLIYSSVPEDDFPLWAAPTAYLLGEKVLRPSTHRIYQRKIAGTTPTAPELDAINWEDIAPTNRHAMFDNVVGTKTTAMQSLTVVMRPGGVAGLGALEMVGQKATVVMKETPGGKVVYTKVIKLDATLITSVYDWFFKPYEQLTDFVLTDLSSHFVGCELTVTISGSSTVSIGVLKFGRISNIGDLQYGASVGISSLSVKSFDTFGNAFITKRGFRKIADFAVVTQAGQFNAIFRKLAALDAVACIYIGTELPGYEPFLFLGFYKDFVMVVPYPTHHLCNMSIEGLI